MISSALAPAVRKGTMESAAAYKSEYNKSPVYLTGKSGTVFNTASAMKAKVPSAPISTCWKMSTAVSKSRKAFSE